MTANSLSHIYYLCIRLYVFVTLSQWEHQHTKGPNSKGIRTFIEKQHLTHAKILICIEPSQISHSSDAIANAAEEEEEAVFTAVDEEHFSDRFW